MDFINSMDYQGKILQLRTSFRELSVEECVKNFMAVVSDIAEKSRAISFKPRNSLPGRRITVILHNRWFDDECKEMKRKVNDCLKKWRQAYSSVFFKQSPDLKEAYKKLIHKML